MSHDVNKITEKALDRPNARTVSLRQQCSVLYSYISIVAYKIHFLRIVQRLKKSF